VLLQFIYRPIRITTVLIFHFILQLEILVGIVRDGLSWRHRTLEKRFSHEADAHDTQPFSVILVTRDDRSSHGGSRMGIPEGSSREPLSICALLGDWKKALRKREWTRVFSAFIPAYPCHGFRLRLFRGMGSGARRQPTSSSSSSS
jgi:hypothetical protein